MPADTPPLPDAEREALITRLHEMADKVHGLSGAWMDFTSEGLASFRKDADDLRRIANELAAASTALADMTAQCDVALKTISDGADALAESMKKVLTAEAQRDAVEARGFQRGLERAAEICDAEAATALELAGFAKSSAGQITSAVILETSQVLAAALRAEPPSAAAASPWRTMESAPRNGTCVLLWLKEGGFGVGWWTDEEGWNNYSELLFPIYWTPLPPPPDPLASLPPAPGGQP